MEFKSDYSNFQLPPNHSADFRLRYNDSDYNFSNFNINYGRGYVKFLFQMLRLRCRGNAYALYLYVYVLVPIYRVAHEKQARRLVDQSGRRSRTLYRKLNKCKCKVLTG